jgi:hypothetical protein
LLNEGRVEAELKILCPTKRNTPYLGPVVQRLRRYLDMVEIPGSIPGRSIHQARGRRPPRLVEPTPPHIISLRLDVHLLTPALENRKRKIRSEASFSACAHLGGFCFRRACSSSFRWNPFRGSPLKPALARRISSPHKSPPSFP